MSDVITAKTGTTEEARRSFMIGLSLWIAAIAVLGGGIFWVGLPAMFDPSSPDFIPVFDGLAFALAMFGSIHIGQGVLRSLRHGKYGVSTLDAGPARVGETYRGKIRTVRPLEVAGPYSIRLLCESRSVSDGHDDRPSSKHRAPVWEAKTTAPASTRSSIGIPFEFHIPADATPSLHGSSVAGQEIYWTLSVSAPMAGLNYRAEFPIDIGTGGEAGDEPAGDGPKSLTEAFVGHIRPENPGMRVLRLVATILGFLLFGAGIYSTANQWLHGWNGVVLSGRVAAINRPGMDVILDGGGTVRVAYIRKGSIREVSQPVELTCLQEGAEMRSCRLDTGFHRWIDALGTLAVGMAMLLFGGWLWARRGRRAIRTSRFTPSS